LPFNENARQVGAAAISREHACVSLMVVTCKWLIANGSAFPQKDYDLQVKLKWHLIADSG